MQIPTEHREQLDRDGYVVLPGFIDPDFRAELRNRIAEVFTEEGERAGSEFKQEPGARRLANMVNKGDVFLRVVANERLLSYVSEVLGPALKLSSLNVRRADPHNDTVQPLHCDMGAVPDEHGPWVCNAVWMIDPYTAINGALRVVPGSHRWGRLPQEVLEDPSAPHPEEVMLTGSAGTVVVMNAHLWHSGLANETDDSRTALHAFYCRRDKPQQQYQRELLSPELQARLGPREREILALDDPLNDELSREVVVRSGFMK